MHAHSLCLQKGKQASPSIFERLFTHTNSKRKSWENDLHTKTGTRVCRAVSFEAKIWEVWLDLWEKHLKRKPTFSTYRKQALSVNRQMWLRRVKRLFYQQVELLTRDCHLSILARRLQECMSSMWYWHTWVSRSKTDCDEARPSIHRLADHCAVSHSLGNFLLYPVYYQRSTLSSSSLCPC